MPIVDSTSSKLPNSDFLINSLSRIELNDSMCASYFGVAGWILSGAMFTIERKFSTVLYINCVPLSLLTRIAEMSPGLLFLYS